MPGLLFGNRQNRVSILVNLEGSATAQTLGTGLKGAANEVRISYCAMAAIPERKCTESEAHVVIDRGRIRKRKKKPSKRFRDKFGHTPLSIEEEIPWKCRQLVIGTGTGALPVMEEVKREAHRRKIRLAILPTTEAIKVLQENPDETNAVLHVTC